MWPGGIGAPGGDLSCAFQFNALLEAPKSRCSQKIAKTLAGHASGILNRWERPINNGRIEGGNDKINMIPAAISGCEMNAFLPEWPGYLKPNTVFLDANSRLRKAPTSRKNRTLPRCSKSQIIFN
jgi:hypothetical protein